MNEPYKVAYRVCEYCENIIPWSGHLSRSAYRGRKFCSRQCANDDQRRNRYDQTDDPTEVEIWGTPDKMGLAEQLRLKREQVTREDDVVEVVARTYRIVNSRGKWVDV